ncbi:response regulator transcription factor [Rothia sp. ARF10]|nr:response regulator transcription factor [Rothia sp. ARF10]
MSEATPQQPVVTVAVVDHELVCLGVRSMLARFADRIHVVPLEPGHSPSAPVDVVLHDAFSPVELPGPDLEGLVEDPLVGAVVLYSWSVNPSVIQAARRRGATAVLPKSLDSTRLADALCLVHRGEPRAATDEGGQSTEAPERPWPGKEVGLTPREAEVVALVATGLSNAQIAEDLHLSLNSVKSYLRSAYRTMGVSTRSQAVLWGIDHGMAPTRVRILLSPAS